MTAKPKTKMAPLSMLDKPPKTSPEPKILLVWFKVCNIVDEDPPKCVLKLGIMMLG